MNLWLIGGTSAVGALVTSPFVRKWLIAHNLFDRPNARSSHTVAVPRGGGIACLMGATAGTGAALATGSQAAWSVLLAALAIASVGSIDDRVGLRAAPRLASQVIIGALLGAWMGGGVWILFGALAFPLLVNVVNFMDGINGITALTLALWGITATITGLSNGVSELSTLGALTAGISIGFLPWNAPVAKLFLGDVGSYLFGALAAGGVLLGATNNISPAVLVAPLSIYLADVLFTLARRARRRARLTEAHREHVYQVLANAVGLPHTVVALWAVGIASAVTLVAATNIHAGLRVLAIGALLITYLTSARLWRPVWPTLQSPAGPGNRGP